MHGQLFAGITLLLQRIYFFLCIGKARKKYIQRDELTHVVLFQNMFKELRKKDPELVEELRDMTRLAVQHEIHWGQYITK